MHMIMELINSYPDKGQLVVGKKYTVYRDGGNILIEENGKTVKLGRAESAEFERLVKGLELEGGLTNADVPQGMPVILKWEFNSGDVHCEGFNKVPQKLSELIKIFRFFTDDYSLQPDRVRDAVVFATNAHAGQVRKGTDIPYITHPLEVWQMLSEMKADENLQVAGILHDVVEDTEVSLQEIEDRFGKEVARLVASHTEDSSLSWSRQKRWTIEMAEKSDKAVQMLIMADKISNLKSMYNDYLVVGERLWERFGSTKEMQSAHNSRLRSALLPLSEDENTAGHYRLLVDLYMRLYVDYYIDYEKGCVYEDICSVQTQLYTRRADMWINVTEIPENAVKVSKKQAQKIIEIWQGERK